jgi:hypothetical protein
MEKAVDHWIVDIKDMNPAIYKAYTGKDNDSVIRNLQYLINKNAKVTVRVPIIPGFNTESDVEKSVLTLQQMGIKDIERICQEIQDALCRATSADWQIHHQRSWLYGQHEFAKLFSQVFQRRVPRQPKRLSEAGQVISQS